MEEGSLIAVVVIEECCPFQNHGWTGREQKAYII